MTRVLAQAIVDSEPVGALHPWRVTVTGGHQGSELTQKRVFHLSAKDDNEAAREGIRLFVAELEAVGP